jgi:hypothetical protein
MRRHRRPAPATTRARAKQFPPKSRAQFIEWDVKAVNGAVFIEVKPPDGAMAQARLTADDAYEFKADIERAIDQIVGI